MQTEKSDRLSKPSLREQFKSGPLASLYLLARTLKRRVTGESPFAADVTFGPLPAAELHTFLEETPDSPRLHFSLAVDLIERGEATALEEAWNHLCRAWETGFESPERLGLYFAVILHRQGHTEEARQVLAALPTYEFSKLERPLREKIEGTTESSPVTETRAPGKVPEGLYQIAAPTVQTVAETPRVSVVLPNYNYAHYLKERIRSILSQTHTDFELVYLDDASPDESNQVASLFAADPRLKMHCFTENSGMVYRRWNDGAARAKGEWLWFAGADDTSDPRFLEVLLATATQHPTAGIIHCPSAIIDSAGRVVGWNWSHRGLSEHLANDYFARGKEDVMRLTAACYFNNTSAMLIRRDAFLECGGYDLRLRQAADWDIFFRLLKNHDIAYTAQQLNYFRKHATSATKVFNAMMNVVENAYCVAAAYLWIREDSRFTAEEKAVVEQRVRARIFDMFVGPELSVPEQYRFALETIYEAVPDANVRRLLKT